MMSIIIDIYRQTPQPSPWSLQFRGHEVWLLSAVRVLSNEWAERLDDAF